MPDPDGTLRPARGVRIPPHEVVVRASRSSGPGGQHANVTASRIEVSFDVHASQALSEEQRRRVAGRCGPVVRAVAQDARSQVRNRQLALARLEQRLVTALHVPRARRATRPSAGQRRARLDDKRKRSERKAGRRRPPTDGD